MLTFSLITLYINFQLHASNHKKYEQNIYAKIPVVRMTKLLSLYPAYKVYPHMFHL